jgi:uncharacterized protein (DUF58 family)
VNLFDQTTLAKIEQLAIIANKVRVGMMKGDRRSRKRGSSIDFADYRDYVPGDDLRRLDWNIFARLERPFIKLLEEEEDLAVHILIDTSASMDWPNSDSDQQKLRYCLRTAGALGYIGLGTGDQVSVSLLSEEKSERWGPHRGRHNGIALFRFLEGCSPGGTTDISGSVRRYSHRALRPGMLFLLSDLLSPSGFEPGLLSLLSKGYEIVLIHVLAPDEVEPPYGGDVKLVDIETRDEAEISMNMATVNLYRQRMEGWRSDINDFCGRHDIHYLPVETDNPWDILILHSLRMEGVLK